MRNFTLRKGVTESKFETRSSFKGFVMLVVMMLMTTSSAMAQGARFEVIDGLRYLLDTGAKTAALMPKTNGKYSGDIVVPEKVKGSDGMEYVVTSLSEKCFSDCSSIKSITIPSSVTSLGKDCFHGCSGLTSITIPSSVISLGDFCFKDCSGLETVYFKGKVPDKISGSYIPTTTIIKVPTEYPSGL